MKKRTLTNPGFPKFKDMEKRLSVEISSDFQPEVTKSIVRNQFIYSIIGLLGGLTFMGIALFIFFTRDDIIENPIINTPIIQISAQQLTISIVLAIIGLIIIFLTRHTIKIKNK